MRDLSSSDGENTEVVQGPSTAPPCPIPVLRPQLKATDVIVAVRPFLF